MENKDPADKSYKGQFGAINTASGVMVDIRGVEVQLYNPRMVDAIKLRVTGPASVEKSYRVIVSPDAVQSAQDNLDPRMIWNANGVDYAWLDVDLITKEATLKAPQTQKAQEILDAVKTAIDVMAHKKAGSIPNLAGYIQAPEAA